MTLPLLFDLSHKALNNETIRYETDHSGCVDFMALGDKLGMPDIGSSYAVPTEAQYETLARALDAHASHRFGDYNRYMAQLRTERAPLSRVVVCESYQKSLTAEDLQAIKEELSRDKHSKRKVRTLIEEFDTIVPSQYQRLHELYDSAKRVRTKGLLLRLSKDQLEDALKLVGQSA